MFLRLRRLFADLQHDLATPLVWQLLTIVVEIGAYLLLLYVWQSRILPAEKGQYSPFQSGLSLVRYVGMIVLLNFFMSVSAMRRQLLWIWLPLIANLFLLGLCGVYLHALLKLN